jgi:hypothetical protein
MTPDTVPILPNSPATEGEGEARVKVASILWRHLEASGRDACDLWRHANGWSVTGTSIFRERVDITHLRYAVSCDAGWRTVRGQIQGSVNERVVDLDVTTDEQHRWWVNGRAEPAVEGCIDLDLNFTPATNLIQLRRLALAVGGRANAPAAWFSVPEFSLQPLPQTYRRASVPCYDYAAPSVGYSGLLQVHELGFVLEYPGLWTAEVLQVWEK